MALMEFSVDAEKVLRNLDRLAKSSPELAFRILTEIGEDGVKETQKRCKIDTASMVSTVRTDLNKMQKTIRVIIGGIMARYSRKGRPRRFVDYALFQEVGTYKMPGVHMLQRGVNKAITKRDTIARKAFKNWISKVSI